MLFFGCIIPLIVITIPRIYLSKMLKKKAMYFSYLVEVFFVKQCPCPGVVRANDGPTRISSHREWDNFHWEGEMFHEFFFTFFSCIDKDIHCV